MIWSAFLKDHSSSVRRIDWSRERVEAGKDHPVGYIFKFRQKKNLTKGRNCRTRKKRVDSKYILDVNSPAFGVWLAVWSKRKVDIENKSQIYIQESWGTAIYLNVKQKK